VSLNKNKRGKRALKKIKKPGDCTKINYQKGKNGLSKKKGKKRGQILVVT